MKLSQSFALVAGALAVTLASAAAQEPASIQVAPDTLRLAVGDSVRIEAQVLDADGDVLSDVPLRFFSRNRRALAVSRDGLAMPKRGGTFEIFAFVTTGRRVSTRIAVIVAFPPIERVAIAASGDRFFVGGTVRHNATVIDAAGMERAEVPVRWSTSDESIATVSQTGLMTAHREGTVSLRATADGVTGEHRYDVVANPIRTVTLSASADSARTGDVIVFSAAALDARGRPVEDAPVTFTLLADTEDSIVAHSPAAEIDDRGRFVAERPGAYTVMAISPGQVAYHSVRITNRHVSQLVQTVGQGAVRDVRTSDLWVWEGVDGRDYAVTGTWGAQGTAYFWDVTNPGAIELIDSIVVDARTVNDVKVSEDGSVCVISREGASNRRNGLVILDCTDPHNVEILATFDDELTGGVHNLFVYRDHIYAVNNGRKYDIINIEDPRNPHRVGVFELDAVGHAVHDVWIVDGIAYSSNWGDGVVLTRCSSPSTAILAVRRTPRFRTAARRAGSMSSWATRLAALTAARPARTAAPCPTPPTRCRDGSTWSTSLIPRARRRWPATRCRKRVRTTSGSRATSSMRRSTTAGRGSWTSAVS